jgi:hypothetical protein
MTHPTPRVRAFLDANVLYSAALGGSLRALWDRPDVALVTSDYALTEAFENLRANEPAEGGHLDRCLDHLESLIDRTELHSAAPGPHADPG